MYCFTIAESVADWPKVTEQRETVKNTAILFIISCLHIRLEIDIEQLNLF
jgi:hypothetical protein